MKKLFFNLLLMSVWHLAIAQQTNISNCSTDFLKKIRMKK
jgi:hypothetical protein